MNCREVLFLKNKYKCKINIYIQLVSILFTSSFFTFKTLQSTNGLENKYKSGKNFQNLLWKLNEFCAYYRRWDANIQPSPFGLSIKQSVRTDEVHIFLEQASEGNPHKRESITDFIRHKNTGGSLAACITLALIWPWAPALQACCGCSSISTCRESHCSGPAPAAWASPSSTSSARSSIRIFWKRLTTCRRR